MIKLLLADVLPLEDPAVYASLYDMASPERRRVADSFRFMKDRRLSVGASALLDAGLKEFGLRERDMTYGRSEYGKPFFMNAPDIHFNISHSSTKLAVAFSDREVGCDIEEVEQDAAKCLEISGRFFCHEEYLAVKAAKSPSECIRMFYRCWTLKESYMKATGLGMTLTPDSFSVLDALDFTAGIPVADFNTPDPSSVLDVLPGLSSAPVPGFVFYTPDSFDGYECALCCRPEAGVPEVRLVTL